MQYKVNFIDRGNNSIQTRAGRDIFVLVIVYCNIYLIVGCGNTKVYKFEDSSHENKKQLQCSFLIVDDISSFTAIQHSLMKRCLAMDFIQCKIHQCQCLGEGCRWVPGSRCLWDQMYTDQYTSLSRDLVISAPKEPPTSQFWNLYIPVARNCGYLVPGTCL